MFSDKLSHLVIWSLFVTNSLTINMSAVDWNNCYASIWDEWTPDTIPSCGNKTMMRTRFANCGLAIGEIVMMENPEAPLCEDKPPPFLPDCNHEGEYIGCISDYPRGMEYIWAGDYMTKELCIESCLELPEQHIFAALQYGNQCCCSRGFQAGLPGKVTNCDMECVGSVGNGTMCGGSYAVSTYCLGEFKVWCPKSKQNSTVDNSTDTNHQGQSTTSHQPTPGSSNSSKPLNCYVKLSRTYNMEEGGDQCKAMGGRLPHFTSQEEIDNYIYYRNMIIPKELNTVVWIGTLPAPNATNITNATTHEPVHASGSAIVPVEGQTMKIADVMNLTEADLGYYCLRSSGAAPGLNQVVLGGCCEQLTVICQFTDTAPRFIFHGDIQTVSGSSKFGANHGTAVMILSLLMLLMALSQTSVVNSG